MTFYYAIADRFLCVEAADQWSAAIASRFIGDFHLQPLPHRPVAGSTFTIRISSQAPAPAPAENLNTFEVAFGQCHTDGKRYFLSVADSAIAVEDNSSISVWVGDSAAARKPLALVNLLAYVLEISLRRSGLYQLHGAGLVPPGETNGVLILGSAGSGKSTLTSLLVTRGWSYMTDDALLLNEETGRVVARGIRRFFAASEVTLASCSLLDFADALGQPMLSDPTKRRLEPEIAFPGRFLSSCIPQTLFFASVTGAQQSEVFPITQAETMSRLIRLNPWASYDHCTARDHLRVLNNLSTQCRAYLFQSGRDLLADPSLAEAMLLPVVRNSSSGHV